MPKKSAMSPMGRNGSTTCAAGRVWTYNRCFWTLRDAFYSPPKPPVNAEKRAQAGLPADFYWPLTEPAA